MKNFGINQVGIQKYQTGTVKGGSQPQQYSGSWGDKGNKIHKPNGHRSILDNGWIPTKRLKKGTYGLIKKHRGGGSAIPTVEEYIAQQIEARKQAALDKSLTRTLPAYPLKNEVMSEQEWNDSLVKREQSTRNSVLPQSIKALNIVGIDSERRAGYANYVGSNCIGPTCAKTAADNYGVDFIGSQQFRDNHANYGFKKVDNKSVKPGDIVIDVEQGQGSHTMMFNRKDNNNVMRFNHSNGGFQKENIRKDAKYPFKGVMETYTFVGTPSDSIQWRNEYKHKYE